MFDVVLFGPTGVTGREVARHLGRRAPALGLRWAVAGRDPARVEAAVAEAGLEPDGILVADTGDPDTIDALAGSAQVVANLVGPYARHGEVVYEACIRHGTTEIDLSGELDWLGTMLRRHGAAAAAAGARLVPLAGFEALPFDLGARLAATTAHARSGEPTLEVDVALRVRTDARIRRPADVVSGGTWASGLGLVRRGAGRASTGPHALDPPTEGPGTRRPESGLRRHAGTGGWLAPMAPLPGLSPPAAHRTAALLRADGDPTFAPRYRYREGVALEGWWAPVVGGTLAGLQFGLAGLARTPGAIRRPITDLVARVGPQPGAGPRREDLARWSYRLDVRATTAGGHTADVTVEAAGHPSYGSTPRLVAEAALLLADPSAVVPAFHGFLTPATALGLDELDRFAEAGLTFQVRG
jgi:short subunit dehydrogenase-like uncharacterized protein